MKTETRVEQVKPLFRSLGIAERKIDEEARTVELAFSSEEPVSRWFGAEILDHGEGSVLLDRLNDNGPILCDHDHRDHVGAISEARVESRRGRLVMRFGRSARAGEIFQDVVDNIRSHVSVGYRIFEMEVDDRDEDGVPLSYRVTKWEPFEVSFVSIPADHSVGVGRSFMPPGLNRSELEVENDLKIIDSNPKGGKRAMLEENDEQQQQQAPAAAARGAAQPDQAAITAARQQGEQAAADTHAKRVSEVLAAGEEYAEFGGNEIARDVLNAGGNVEDFNKRMLKEMGKGDATRAESPDLGMTDKEKRKYSFLRAINAFANPQDTRAQEAAAFELECHSEASRKLKKEARGIVVPVDVLRVAHNIDPELYARMQRDLTVGTATAGGHTVATDLLSGSFIDVLRNAALMLNPGMSTVLTDLNGNIAIPRQTGGATAYWVAENGAVTESQQAFDQVTLSPNTVGAYTEYSRKLLLQSSIDVEAFVRRDLAMTLALAIDLAAINGSGASNQPTGILNVTGIGDVAGGTNGLAPTWDHIVDLETEVAVDNAAIGNLQYLVNAVTRGKLKKTFVDSGSNAERVWDTRAPGSPLNGYRAQVTNQVPSDLDKGTSTGVCSAIIFGNFLDLIIGMWGGLDIQVNPFSLDTTGGVRVTALQDVDIAVRHPESFAAMQDALTT